jgi:hypothetical protein
MEDLLQKALESPHGIGIRSADVEHLKRLLETVRAAARNRGLDIYKDLIFRAHPPYIELYILKSESLADAEDNDLAF